MEIARDAFVDGAWHGGSQRFEVRDPFDNALVAAVTDSEDNLIDAAVAASSRAFTSWRRVPGPERGKLLRQIGEQMLADEGRLGELCTRENGKPLRESIAEVRYAASFMTWFAGEAERIYGETIPATSPDQRLVAVREPVGPCGVITPWNFPYAMLARKLGAALAAGCTVVAKPAHQTPLGTLAIAQIAERVGLPAGVFNVVPAHDGARAGGRIIKSRLIRKLSFTGSTAVGRVIMRDAAADLKRVSLELGGNAPFVVLADADVEAAVAGAVVAKFRNTGQTCVAANRFIVEAPVAEEFTRKLVSRVANLVVGHGMDPKVDIGPLIDDEAVAKVKRLVDDAIAKGARVLGGASPNGSGHVVAPLVVDKVSSAMDLWREEIFGPVVAIRIATTETEAIELANDTEFGLVAYVFTRDGARQTRVAEALEAGMVGVNEGLVSTAQAPFGGIKQSGMGREGSRHGIEDYTHLKYVATRIG
jgi:succinate-semialdehyde dehydrogenase/glutarate-semialdehyde dehydrogenase